MITLRRRAALLTGVLVAAALAVFFAARTRPEAKRPSRAAQTTKPSAPSRPADAKHTSARPRPEPPPAFTNDEPAPTLESIEELARHDAARALSIALGQTEASVRHAFLLATIRGWAKGDMEAAGKWVLGQAYMGEDEAWGAFFNGAVTQREDAIRYARQISSERPAQAEVVSQALISSLGQAGEYERAAQFAAENAESELAIKLLSSAYRQWSEQTPELATLSALTLKTPEARSFALQAAVPVWARTDPHGLAEKAKEFPAGPEKQLALTMALRAWTEKDFEAAAAWIMRWEPTGALSSVDLKFVMEN
jgi:hypothetical protein